MIDLLAARGVAVHEASIARDQLYCADEVFLTGTAAEVTPVREIDRRQVGKGGPGPVTRFVQDDYAKLVRGEGERSGDFCDRVVDASARSESRT